MRVKSIAEESILQSTCIKLPFVIKIFVLSILSGRFIQVLLYVHVFYTGFTVCTCTINPKIE